MDKAPASHDHQRGLEQNALRNARALVEKLEHDEAQRSASLGSGLLLSVALIAALAAALAGVKLLTDPPPRTAEQARCESRHFSARMERAGELMQRWRDDPALTPQDVKRKFDEYQRDVRRDAALECTKKA